MYVYRASAYDRTEQHEKARQNLNTALDRITASLARDPGLLKMHVVRDDLNMLTGNFEQTMQGYKTACDKGFKEGCRKVSFPF